MPASRHIFESQCDPDVRVNASWAVANSDELLITISAGRTRSDVFLGRQDAEAMARAILGIADPPPILEWDALAKPVCYQCEKARNLNSQGFPVGPPCPDHPLPGIATTAFARYAELRSLS